MRRSKRRRLAREKRRMRWLYWGRRDVENMDLGLVEPRALHRYYRDLANISTEGRHRCLSAAMFWRSNPALRRAIGGDGPPLAVVVRLPQHGHGSSGGVP